MLQFIYINRKIKKVRTIHRQTEILTFLIEIPIKEKYRRNAEDQKAKKKASRRNENGLTKKQQDLKSKIECLREKGLSNRKISKELNISEGKVRTTLKE